MIKMRKLFLKLSMLLFVLGMSVNAAWANFDALPLYSAKLTAQTSSTGGGKVYVTHDVNYNPVDEDYKSLSADSAGMVISMQGMDQMKVSFSVWQKADKGYYFVGWSKSNEGTDLGNDQPYADLYEVSNEKGETIDNEQGQPTEVTKWKPLNHYVYATFEPIRIVNYAISGDNTIEGTSCTQTVTFTLSGEGIDTTDFYAPAIISSTGGGSWTNTNGKALSISDLSISGTTATVEVKFTAPGADAAEYTANLQLKTKAKANIAMNVPLGARLIEDGVEAIRLNKSKVQYEGEDGSGTLENMLTKAVTGDIIKLNGDYDAAVEINKNITFDLNGYALSNTLTVSSGNVTLAYSPFGGSASALSVTGGKAILNGGTFGTLTIGENGTVEQNGATFTGAATNEGELTTLDGVFQSGLTTVGTLIVNGGTFNGTIAINITGGSAQIKKGTIAGTKYGVQTNGGSATIEKLAVISGGTKALNGINGALTVNNGKFTHPDNLIAGTTVTFKAGYFQNATGTTALGKHVWRNTAGAEFRDGYNFFVGDANAAKAAGVSVCHIGGTSYSTLEDALAYANNTNISVTIIMDNDYVLPAGYYTLPANATLIIPMSNEQGSEYKVIDRAIGVTPDTWVKPEKFRCLTLSEGVNLDVFGTIEVSGTQFSTYEAFTGSVYGPYGQMQLNQGSKITLQNGSELRAWGFVTGDLINQDAQHHVPMGEIDARRGSTVREQFQMGDWKRAAFSGMGLLQGNTVFPLVTYFIQNIEAPVKYHPGAKLSTTTSVTATRDEFSSHGINLPMDITMSANNIPIIGVAGTDTAMFLMDEMADAENTWVRKWYDASKDQQVYEINSGAYIGNLVIPLVSSPMLKQFMSQLGDELTMNSGQYYLPITNNFKLHLLSGTMQFTQSTELLPGSEVEIDKEGTAQILADDPDDNVQGGYLFVYDKNEWGNYAGGVPARKVKYSPVFDNETDHGVPSTRGITKEDLQSASINVHGTFDAFGGQVYVSESGANIFSSVEDAGTFLFSEDATDATVTVNQVTTATGGGKDPRQFVSIKLKNADGVVPEYTESYIDETHYAESGDAYCYLDVDGTGAKWTSLIQDNACFMHDEANGIYYAKPQEYVAVTSNVEDPVTHTFSDLAGAGRLFIKIINEEGLCQWWEVEAKDNYYHCIHPDNDTYYEWDGSKWVEKKFTITWKDWDGTTITTYSVPYGTQAEWLSTNPTREPSDDYTYDFTGWSPALGKVTSDVTYTATYEEKQIKYTITFVQDGGVEIERHLLARDEVPVCENVPTRTGYILQWEPSIEPVVGNQTYTATWLPEPPDTFTVTFKNYDGAVILKYTGTGENPAVIAGKSPIPPTNPIKPQTSEYTYSFIGWKGPKGFTAKEETLPAATENATYVAQFTEEPRQYTINFYREDGTTLIETQYIPYGGEPVIPAYTKANTAQYTYSIAWKNKENNANIQSVTGNVDYKAVVTATTNKYNVKLVSNPSGACVLVGNGIYEYDEAEDAVTISVTNIAANHTFTGWSDDPENTNTTRQMAITGDINLVANFTVTDPDYKINWWNEAGTEKLVPEVGQKANTNTIYPGATPTKEATAQYTYSFDGWATTANGARAYKKGMTPKATADADYYAHFEATVNNYEVTLTASPASAATFSGLGVYPYNENADAVTLTVIPNAGYTFTGWSDGQAGTNLTRQMAITDNIHLVANFEVDAPDYIVTWKSEDGSQTLAEVGHKYKTQSTYKGELPSKASTAEYGYTFDGWTSEANGAGTYYANGSTPKVVADATYYAHFNRATIGVEVAENKTIDQDLEVATTTVYVEGTLNIASGNTLTTDNLVIEADPDHSGQITGAGTVDADNVYFDLTRGAGNVFKHHTWYAFSVPFTVDASQILFDGETMQYGQTEKKDDYDVIYYDGSVRATEGKTANCWKYVEKATSTYLYPGTLYMIANTKRDVTKLRFTKATGALLTTAVSVEAHAQTTGFISDANWNGIANPALFHANLSGVGAAENIAWVYNPDYADPTNAYVKINDLSARDLILGEAIFVQTATGTTIDVTPTTASPVRRRTQTFDSEARYQVKIAKADGNATDDVIIRTDEDKEEDAYVLGRDLVRMGMSSINPQLWINRYDEKLCVNVAKPINEEANYPLGIFAPADGEYRLFTETEPNEQTALYLTLDGEAIWNLSDAPYTFTLNKGTSANYGLRISAKKAPQTATGVDEAIVDAQGETRKVLIDNKVFIIRGDKVYSVDGQLVK